MKHLTEALAEIQGRYTNKNFPLLHTLTGEIQNLAGRLLVHVSFFEKEIIRQEQLKKERERIGDIMLKIREAKALEKQLHEEMNKDGLNEIEARDLQHKHSETIALIQTLTESMK